MQITAIRSDPIYREMMNAAPAEKENIYREQLKPAQQNRAPAVGALFLSSADVPNPANAFSPSAEKPILSAFFVERGLVPGRQNWYNLS